MYECIIDEVCDDPIDLSLFSRKRDFIYSNYQTFILFSIYKYIIEHFFTTGLLLSQINFVILSHYY
jgi:hypothetical protein